MDTQLNALPTLPVLAQGVSGCLNSAFLGLFYTSCGPSFQAMDTQVTRQRSGTGRPSVEGDRPVRRPCPSQRNKSHKKRECPSIATLQHATLTHSQEIRFEIWPEVSSLL